MKNYVRIAHYINTARILYPLKRAVNGSFTLCRTELSKWVKAVKQSCAKIEQHAEVILTFAVDSLISFLADNKASRAKLAQMGMDAHIDWVALEKLRSAAAGRE